MFSGKENPKFRDVVGLIKSEGLHESRFMSCKEISDPTEETKENKLEDDIFILERGLVCSGYFKTNFSTSFSSPITSMTDAPLA